jgi:hypothetical protein
VHPLLLDPYVVEVQSPGAALSYSVGVPEIEVAEVAAKRGARIRAVPGERRACN